MSAAWCGSKRRFSVSPPELAIAVATATFADGRVFTESADATPANAGARIRVHFPASP